LIVFLTISVSFAVSDSPCFTLTSQKGAMSQIYRAPRLYF